MLFTKGLRLQDDELIVLKDIFEKNSSSYEKEAQSERHEIKRVVLLFSPIIILAVFVFISEILSGAFVFLGVLIFLLMFTGMIRSQENKQIILKKIYEEFLGTRASIYKTFTINNSFYAPAYTGKILVSQIGEKEVYKKHIEEIQIEADNIHVMEGTGKSSYTVEYGFLGKITYPSHKKDISILIQRNTTNNINGIFRRIIESLGYSLLIISLYYIFVVENCDYNSFDGGCDNTVNFIGLFQVQYFIYFLIIGIIIFFIGYIKTFIKKETKGNASRTNNIDIYLNRGNIDNISLDFLNIVECYILNMSKKGIQYKILIEGDFIYVKYDRNYTTLHNNFIIFMIRFILRGISRKYVEKQEGQEIIKFIDFVHSLEKLGKDLKTFYK